ncbi:MAG: XdhC family protein [Polyangiales bacterium]
MLDSAELIAAAAELRAAGEPFVIATVVRVRGSSYRRPGARMILSERGRIAGSVSGGCLEGNLVRTGLWKTADGPVIVTFDSTDPDDPDAVLGCGGVVDILLERGGPRDPLVLASEVLATGRSAAIATALTGPELGMHRIIEPPGEHTGATKPWHDGDVLIEPITPPIQLYVFGAGLDAVPVVEAATRLGWTIHLWSGAPRFENAARFPLATLLEGDLDAVRVRIDASDRAVAIVMSHHQRRDQAALAMLVASRAAYIGVLGPRHRAVEIAAPGTLDDPRVHAPVGLDLGAETPAEIAVAVIAEVLAAIRGTTAASLRTRATIHSR